MNTKIKPPPLSDDERDHGSRDERESSRKHSKPVVRREINLRKSPNDSSNTSRLIESNTSGFDPNLVIFLSCTVAIIGALFVGMVILLF